MLTTSVHYKLRESKITVLYSQDALSGQGRAVSTSVHKQLHAPEARCQSVALHSASPMSVSSGYFKAVEPRSCSSPDVGSYFPRYCATGVP